MSGSGKIFEKRADGNAYDSHHQQKTRKSRRKNGNQGPASSGDLKSMQSLFRELGGGSVPSDIQVSQKNGIMLCG